MYMKKSNGSNFSGRGGLSYNADGVVEPGDTALALANGWVPFDPGTANVLAATLPSGATHNFIPPGMGAATKRLELTCNAAGSTLGGLQGGEDEQEVLIANVGASGTLTITHQDASSSAANRFMASADVTVAVGDSVLTRYSATQGRWLVVK